MKLPSGTRSQKIVALQGCLPWSARAQDPQVQETGKGRQESGMSGLRPAGQIKGRGGNAQPVEAGRRDLGRI